MIATLLDTKTGETRITDNTFSSWWWAEGNGCCDCNREIPFYTEDGDEEDDEDIGFCLGCHRYLIIAAEFVDTPAHDGGSEYRYTLRELNEGYPEELLDKYLPKQ